MHLPDYHGGSIVNLVRSIEAGLGARPCGAAAAYPTLRDLPPRALAGAANVVLLVIDGLGHDYLARKGAGTALSRHLKGRLTSVFPSTTATAVSALLTGVGPQQHALPGWHAWLREMGCLAAMLRFTPRYGGEVFSKAGVDRRMLYTAEPVFDRLPLAGHMFVPSDIVDSDYNIAHCGGAARHGYGALEQAFELCAAIINKGTGHFAHLYIPYMDWTAHSHGCDSPQLQQMLLRVDAAFQRFLDTLRGSGTLVIATADHGFIDSPSASCIELDAHPQLARTLALPLCGERRVCYCYVHPGREAEFEACAGGAMANYADQHRSEDLLARGWFGLGEPNPRLAERIGHYTLVMKDDYTLKDWLPGETRYLQLGVHGGLSADEMHVPLIVAET